MPPTHGDMIYGGQGEALQQVAAPALVQQCVVIFHYLKPEHQTVSQPL